ncbi:MAG: signal peptidase II [Candidatus Moranbacteria bacterium]|nr:signal peptidase II [Candidatus Moranbacteria bacterium]
MQQKFAQPNAFLFLILLVFGTTSTLAIDQLLKYKIRQHGGFYICNQGISFGLPIRAELFWLILAIFLLLEITYIIRLLKNNRLQFSLAAALSLVTGGILSNGLDRYIHGCVTDHIYIKVQFLPVFNFADIAIFLGFCLFYITLLKNDRHTGDKL